MSIKAFNCSSTSTLFPHLKVNLGVDISRSYVPANLRDSYSIHTAFVVGGVMQYTDTVVKVTTEVGYLLTIEDNFDGDVEYCFFDSVVSADAWIKARVTSRSNCEA